MSKYKSIFDKGNTQNWSKEVFVAPKIKNTVPRTDAISDLSVKMLLEIFMKKKLQKNKSKRIQNRKIY